MPAEKPTVAGKPSAKALAWPLFDAIVDQSAFKSVNPWAADGSFSPDYGALRKLLAGTGLTFKYLDERTVTIVPLATESSTPSSTTRRRLGR